jgi:hypothetical protein
MLKRSLLGSNITKNRFASRLCSSIFLTLPSVEQLAPRISNRANRAAIRDILRSSRALNATCRTDLHFFRASSSIAFVADAVRIAHSLAMLTTGMQRGLSYHIATLDLQATPYPLYEFCLILSLFGVFSPDYKLLGEQCYWFVDVVFKAIQRRTNSTLIAGQYHHLAGKYGKVKIRQSDEVRTRLLETFEALAEFHGLAGVEDKQDSWAAKSHLIPHISLLLHPTANESDARTHQILAVSIELQYRSAARSH